MTHVFLSHHHPDHTVNIALFPNAEVVDFWARYRDDLWLDHDGDGYHLSPERPALADARPHRGGRVAVVEADDATYAMTHLWWHADRTPEIDPLAADQAAIEVGRARVLAAADIVIPGHGGPFRGPRLTRGPAPSPVRRRAAGVDADRRPRPRGAARGARTRSRRRR